MSFIGDVVPEDHWQEWPAENRIIAMDECPNCKGEGHTGDPTCKHCRGSLVHECECGYRHSCGSCGKRTCQQCNGDGDCFWPCLQVVGNRWVYVGLEEKAKSLASVHWAVTNDLDSCGPILLRFEFKGLDEGQFGYGAVMPVDQSEIKLQPKEEVTEKREVATA